MTRPMSILWCANLSGFGCCKTETFSSCRWSNQPTGRESCGFIKDDIPSLVFLKKRALSPKPNVLVLACLLRNTNAESKKSLGWCHHQVTRHPMLATETSLLPTDYHLKNETCSKSLVRRLLCSWHLPPFSSLHRSEHWPRKQSRGIQHFSVSVPI